MTTNKDISLCRGEISNQEAEREEKQAEGGRKRTETIQPAFTVPF